VGGIVGNAKFSFVHLLFTGKKQVAGGVAGGVILQFGEAGGEGEWPHPVMTGIYPIRKICQAESDRESQVNAVHPVDGCAWRSYSNVTTLGSPCAGPGQDRTNKRKHGLSLETAQLVFDDPLAVSRFDASIGEERWQTIGIIGHVAVFVVHTSPKRDRASGEEVGRIITARKATSHERRAYEEGQF
jgi:uncharacterized protein